MFLRLDDMSDSDEAISLSKEAVFATPDGDPRRGALWNTPGTYLNENFRRTGVVEFVDEAIAASREAIKTTPDGQPDGPARMNNLCTGLHQMAGRMNTVEHLEEVISILREVVALIPEGHPQRAHFWRYQATNGRTLDEGIKMIKEAVELTPADSSARSSRLGTLGALMLQKAKTERATALRTRL